jgi:NADPH2:quinone reductase
LGATGVPTKLGAILIDLAGVNLAAMVMLAFVFGALLGTGLPPAPTYILVAIVIAPPMTRVGVNPWVVHFFAFFLGVWGELTPPTSLVAAVTAKIANASFYSTLNRALQICVSLFTLMAGVFVHPKLVIEPGVDQFGAALLILIATIGITFSLQAIFADRRGIDVLVRLVLAAFALFVLLCPNEPLAAAGCLPVLLLIGYWLLRRRGAGVVEAVGEGVKKVKRGDRVYTTQTLSGAYAEYALALEHQVHPLSAKISFSQGSGVWVPYGTAYHALYHSAKAHASETVLVHGASGGVGIAAVQIARSMGLMILGTAGTPTGLEITKREGAHQVFDHHKTGYQEEILKATGNRGVDIILEMLANVNLAYDTKLLAKDGRVIVIGNRGEVTINARELMMRRASIRAFTLWDITPAEEADIHAGLIAGLENGTLHPVVGKELPLAEAARTHKEILEPGASGKIVLVC